MNVAHKQLDRMAFYFQNENTNTTVTLQCLDKSLEIPANILLQYCFIYRYTYSAYAVFECKVLAYDTCPDLFADTWFC